MPSRRQTKARCRRLRQSRQIRIRARIRWAPPPARPCPVRARPAPPRHIASARPLRFRSHGALECNRHELPSAVANEGHPDGRRAGGGVVVRLGHEDDTAGLQVGDRLVDVGHVEAEGRASRNPGTRRNLHQQAHGARPETGHRPLFQRHGGPRRVPLEPDRPRQVAGRHAHVSEGPDQPVRFPPLPSGPPEFPTQGDPRASAKPPNWPRRRTSRGDARHGPSRGAERACVLVPRIQGEVGHRVRPVGKTPSGPLHPQMADVLVRGVRRAPRGGAGSAGSGTGWRRAPPSAVRARGPGDGRRQAAVAGRSPVDWRYGLPNPAHAPRGPGPIRDDGTASPQSASDRASGSLPIDAQATKADTPGITVGPCQRTSCSSTRSSLASGCSSPGPHRSLPRTPGHGKG